MMTPPTVTIVLPFPAPPQLADELADELGVHPHLQTDVRGPDTPWAVIVIASSVGALVSYLVQQFDTKAPHRLIRALGLLRRSTAPTEETELRLVDEANDVVVIIDGAAATDEKAMVALLDLEVEAIRPHAAVRWSPRLRRWRTDEGQLRGVTAEKATGPRDGRPPRVFVSYAHDSPQHKALVLAFATLLRRNGVDADLDQWNTGERRDWYTWMIKQVTEADYVMAVASPKYRHAADGDAAPDEHRGVQSEAALLRDLLHADRRTWVPKLLPVVLPGSTVEDIPLFLQPHCADRFEVSGLTPAGVKDLVDHVSGQPAHIRPDLGPLPVHPPHTTGPIVSARATEPPDQPMTVAQPTRPLAAEREVLIHKLYEVRLLRQPDTRSELIWQVEQQLGSGINVERSPVDRIDLRRFVDRCFDFSYGPQALLDVLHGGEGDSLPFRDAADLLVTLAARHGYPGLDGYGHARPWIRATDHTSGPANAHICQRAAAAADESVTWPRP